MNNSDVSSALVIGASGGIGSSITTHLQSKAKYGHVWALDRSSIPRIDLLDESSIIAAAARVAEANNKIALFIIATGFLHNIEHKPEKRLKDVTETSMMHAFAINAAGPAMVLKHFLPLAPKKGRSVFICLSARVGSIEDNTLGGWHSYRASKAALNQLVRTMAIELRRTRPDAILASIHPGTTATSLSAPFSKQGLDVRSPEIAAEQIINVIENLTLQDSGGFFDHMGKPIPW
jgi:NAD(P)-dependent dehydrogenase (short-subunit alcohol dehydrogenase family)